MTLKWNKKRIYLKQQSSSTHSHISLFTVSTDILIDIISFQIKTILFEDKKQIINLIRSHFVVRNFSAKDRRRLGRPRNVDRRSGRTRSEHGRVDRRAPHYQRTLPRSGPRCRRRGRRKNSDGARNFFRPNCRSGWHIGWHEFVLEEFFFDFLFQHFYFFFHRHINVAGGPKKGVNESN